MIGNLVGAGHRVVALGRSERSRERIRRAGAEEASSISALAEAAEVVITMLPDTPDVEQCALRPGGLLESMSSGQVYVDMSTISPATSAELARRFAETGVDAVDAPVSGGEQAAIEGTLSVMAGGSAEAIGRVTPVLEAMSGSIIHVGPAGSGQRTKAANQLIVAANLQAVSEAIVLLESSGVDVAAALTAINGGLAGSTVLTRKRDAFLTRSFEPGFRVELHDKDLRIVQQICRDSELTLPVADVVAELMAELHRRGDGKLDHSALLKLVTAKNSSAST